MDATAESYIGSIINLTSKYEIRYEGVLYNIDTTESSIGLRNVRSFGTEGRKKDGPQIAASDKIYEYILFRGSDIKDLQVKSSPHVQNTSIHNDPAIIQSHYSRPATTTSSATLPSIGSGTVADPHAHTDQMELPGSTFQGGLPLYQPVVSLGSWGSAPTAPTPNGSGLPIPMYWQGFYPPTGGIPHLQQTPLFRPPLGLPIPQTMQQPVQYLGINPSLASGSSNLPESPSQLPSQNLTSTTLPSTLAPTQASVLAPETSSNPMPNIGPMTSLPATTLPANLPFVPPFSSSHDSIVASQSMPSVVSSKPRAITAPTLAYQSMAQSMPLVAGSLSSSQVEPSVSLVTPDQLTQPIPSALPSSQPLQTSHTDVVVKQSREDVQSKQAGTKIRPSPTESSVLAPAEAKEQIPPLPKPAHHRRPNGVALHMHHYNRGRGSGRGRGRGRGRGNGYLRPVTKFTEDFDFMAMNEKFNKDEVWGQLGKTKGQSCEREEDAEDDEADNSLEEDDEESLKTKPVYVKDDFFDTLSCNTQDHGTPGGRIKFSEQLKVDTQTFGDFPRHRPFRGSGRGFHNGGRARGSYYGRGYGYIGRGRGNAVYAISNRAS